MGVYIEGMEMPKDCNSCRFSGFGGLRNERIVCMFTGSNDYLNQQERFSDCPLIELPTPHGRLVDADVLTDCYERIGKDRWNQSIGAAKYFDEAIDLLEMTPTVIEAEEGT